MTAIDERTGHLRVREIDWLMAAVIALCCLGLVMAVSIAGSDTAVGPLRAAHDQAVKLGVGAVVFLVAVTLPLRVFRAWSGTALALAIGLCALALLFDGVNGARRWIKFGGMSLQPVELARFALVVFVAASVARAEDGVASFRGGFVRIMAPAGLLGGILALQPDVGNAAFAVTIAAVMALVGGVRLMHFLLVGLPLMVPAAWMVLGHDHVRRRLTGFLEVEPGGQVFQGLVSIASGGLLGRGLGDGWMKMGFVPEAGNDFVFAVIGEELGLFGGVLVLALYTTIGWVGLRLFQVLEDPFHRMLVLGFSFAICMQAAINLLVVTGMAPAKGIDLPFLSSGGTNLVFSMGAVGIIGNAARADYEQRA